MSASGERSVAIGGDNSGIVSIGDGARNVQMRAQASGQGRVYQAAGDQTIHEGDDRRHTYGGDHLEFHHNTFHGEVVGKQVISPESAAPDRDNDGRHRRRPRRRRPQRRHPTARATTSTSTTTTSARPSASNTTTPIRRRRDRS
ncbi:unnamed protein product [[Actinomadura] parvosata subsp. kistnae]|nr:unnamed protein product [Actinomadura parvosata subsp. kistnae]